MAWVIARDTSYRNYTKRIYWLKPRVDVFGSGSGSSSGLQEAGAGLSNLDLYLVITVTNAVDIPYFVFSPNGIVYITGGLGEDMLGDYTFKSGRFGAGWYIDDSRYGPGYYVIVLEEGRFCFYIGEYKVLITQESGITNNIDIFNKTWEMFVDSAYYGPGVVVNFQIE